VYVRKIRPPTNWTSFQGEWAIVTGASEGIGKAYALALAKRRINVVLLARRAEALQTLAVEIKERYNVDARTHAFDFLTEDPGQYDQLVQQFSNLKVSILINNVGGPGRPYNEKMVTFTDAPVEHVWGTTIVNIRPTVYLTKLFLPIMRSTGHGAIINVSSLAGAICFPLSPTYGGSKAFIDNFTLSVAREFKAYNIAVQCAVPGMVKTKLNATTPIGWDCCSPETFVEESLNLHGSRIVFAPWINHGAYRFVLGHLPQSLGVAIGGAVGDKILKDYNESLKDGTTDQKN